MPTILFYRRVGDAHHSFTLFSFYPGPGTRNLEPGTLNPTLWTAQNLPNIRFQFTSDEEITETLLFINQ